MKKIIFYMLSISILSLFFGNIYAATTTDTQLLDLENKAKLGQIQQLNTDFHLKKFTSCQNMEDTITSYIKTYFKSFPNRWGGAIDSTMMYDNMAVKSSIPDAENIQGSSAKIAVDNVDKAGTTDYSATNIQVLGVDESELIKTDGKNIYFYNEKNHSIYIAKAFPAKDLSILKIIKIPDSFTNPELYISGNKLVVIANKYSNLNYTYYWFARSTKTVVVVYDISNIEKLTIDKFYEVDGDNIKSRMIDKYLYTLSKVNFSFPYPIYYSEGLNGAEGALNTSSIDKDFNANKVLPKKIELRKTTNINEQNFSVKGKPMPYNLSQNTAGNCTDIEYVMPDESTIKKYNFTPSYVVLSILNTEDPTETVKTKILFGDVSEIYMSLDNLYIASNLYVSYDFSCPKIQCIKAPCISNCLMPYYYRGENTLLHKIGISGNIAQYKNSNVIPGRPLNQYSMDQNDAGYFRIITSSSYPKTGTNLFILDKDLKSVGSLTNLASGENFQSSRFIGDKLYLVTFQQIDPLFVIDVSDNTNPKVLGELKIPGYSTYLHPYDSTHLIGLGYDTKTNQWGGTQNAGLKVDLYDISDFAKPKQQYSLTLGNQGSNSEVLNNPRLFVWNSSRNLLFLPATLYVNANDTVDTYRNKDAFQGSVVLNIDKNKGIKEISRITHIKTDSLENQRTEECKKYSDKVAEPCKTLIGGGQYCPAVSNYVPPYCYTDSPIGEYFANQIWNFSSSFIIRNLYLDNTLFTVSNGKIQSNDMDNNFNKTGEVEMK